MLVQEVLFPLNCPKLERLWEKEQVVTLIKHLFATIFLTLPGSHTSPLYNPVFLGT